MEWSESCSCTGSTVSVGPPSAAPGPVSSVQEEERLFSEGKGREGKGSDKIHVRLY